MRFNKMRTSPIALMAYPMILSRPNSASPGESWEYFPSPLFILPFIGLAPGYFSFVLDGEKKARRFNAK
jgi:hypothetical protein